MDLGPPSIELRRAGRDDADLIERILLLAGNWRGDEQAVSLSDLSRAYYEDWGRPDDLGVLAFDGPWFIGGAFARRVGPADGTYGFVDPDLLELAIGIEVEHRGMGIGRLVLESLKAQCLERGVGGLSLSVERDNTAARTLYESAKFGVVEERNTDLVFVWRAPAA